MYSYPLSKRTSLYAAYSYFSNDKYSLPMQTQLAPITTAVTSPGIGAVGESNYAIGAGMTHSFLGFFESQKERAPGARFFASPGNAFLIRITAHPSPGRLRRP
jgi:hypothetical protein